MRIIAPFAAGGAADTLGRLIAEQLSTVFRQQFFVENRGGAGGIVGAATVAAADPDGYTLVVSSIASNVVSPVFNGNAGYDGLRDFTHIAYLGGPPAVMIVHPSFAPATYREFVALARASKEPLSYISPGTGSNGFLVAEELARRDGYNISHIPYKGAGPALADLVAGHVKLGTVTFSTTAELIRSGKVRALGVTTERRIPNFPDIPTFREMGQDLVAATWFGLSGPARLPNDIVQAISRETLKAMQSPEVQKRLALDAIETKLMSPEEYTRFVEAETARWARLPSRSPRSTKSSLDRHRHRLEGGVAVDQVDALLDDAEAGPLAPQPMALAAGENALLIVAQLDHDHRRTDQIFAGGVSGLLDHHVADQMCGARGRRLHMDARVLQALDPCPHQVAVVIEQRCLVERALLIGHRRHPIGAVLGEQLHPIAESALVEQARLVDEELLERGAIDPGGVAGRRVHHAASPI